MSLSQKQYVPEGQSFRAFLSWLTVAAALLSVSGCFLTPPDVTDWYCTTKSDCLSPLICNPNAQKCQTPCFQDSDCSVLQLCIDTFCQSRDQDDGGPQDNCQPQKVELCNGIDDNCNGQVDEGISCLSEGERCDLAASPPKSCKPGLICEAFTVMNPRICLKTCASDPSSCRAGFQCVDLGRDGIKICVESPCVSDSACTFAQEGKGRFLCEAPGGQTKLCRPAYPDGVDKKITFGALCSPNDQQHCFPPYRCARRRQDTLGICSLRCSGPGDASCTKYGAGASCQLIESNFYVCLPACQGQACPTGFVCQKGICTFQ